MHAQKVHSTQYMKAQLNLLNHPTHLVIIKSILICIIQHFCSINEIRIKFERRSSRTRHASPVRAVYRLQKN